MRENDKLKSVEGGELEKLKQSVRDKTAENKRLKQQVDACATTSGQGDSRGSQKATTKTPVANNTMKEDSTVTVSCVLYFISIPICSLVTFCAARLQFYLA